MCVYDSRNKRRYQLSFFLFSCWVREGLDVLVCISQADTWYGRDKKRMHVFVCLDSNEQKLVLYLVCLRLPTGDRNSRRVDGFRALSLAFAISCVRARMCAFDGRLRVDATFGHRRGCVCKSCVRPVSGGMQGLLKYRHSGQEISYCCTRLRLGSPDCSGKIRFHQTPRTGLSALSLSTTPLFMCMLNFKS